MARWYRSGRYYGKRRYYRRYGYGSSKTSRKSWGNMKAAKQQADQSTFTVNIPTTISAFSQNQTLNGKERSLGVYAMNIFDQLRKSEFFSNYANMYDEFKIDRVKVKLLPTNWASAANTNGNYYKNLTVYTAWDRSGLTDQQYELFVGTDYGNLNIPGISANTWVIGTPTGHDTGSGIDYGGLYVTIGSDLTTYSSAESRVINPNTNTTITRWINPKTMQEKSQWLSTGLLKPWYLEYDGVKGRYIKIPVTDIAGIRNDEEIAATEQVAITGDGTVTGLKGILKSSISALSSDNPCSLTEDQGIRFKPTLLVGIYPNDQNTAQVGPNNDQIPINTVSFNVETEVVCSFRGLRKASVVAA